jgi:hypothetical protein
MWEMKGTVEILSFLANLCMIWLHAMKGLRDLYHVRTTILGLRGLQLLAVWGWIAAFHASFGQTTSVSGVINTVSSRVTAVDPSFNSMTLESATGFSVGDTVLIIQMKGATMNTANAGTFGDIVSPGGAGLYEANFICDIAGTTLTFERVLLNSYGLAGLQVLRVPSYHSVVIAGSLTSNPWNGLTGGVVVFGSSTWVRLDADISVTGKGFRNGWDYSNYSACSCGSSCLSDPQYTDYSYPMNSCRAADKGEGVADSVSNMEFGKGKESTGGGGGNDHNAGGGGGGNFGSGGNGGTANNATCAGFAICRGLHPGVGGLSLNASGLISNGLNRVFLGGGGGAGHDNNGTGTAGGKGAGIVIIIADSIDLNGRAIIASGESVMTPSQSDGCGAGGAGGSILLSARAVRNSSGTLDVRGGNGGSDNWTVDARGRKGPGGGGGGGVIGSSNPLPGTLTTLTAGGTNGTNAGGANGAQIGGAGGILEGPIPPVSGSGHGPCLLSVTMQYFTAEAFIPHACQLRWQTTSEFGILHFEVQRSSDGSQFETMGRVAASRSMNGEGASYRWLDAAPMTGVNWYRLRVVDRDGRSSLTEAVYIRFAGPPSLAVRSLYPNPVNASEDVTLELEGLTNHKVSILVTDIVGKQMCEMIVSMEEGITSCRIPTRGMTKGIYLLRMNGGRGGEVVRKLEVN